MPRVIVGVAGLYSMIMSAERRSNLQPFTGNGDVSIWVKNSEVGRKTTHKQTNKHNGESKVKILGFLNSKLHLAYKHDYWWNVYCILFYSSTEQKFHRLTIWFQIFNSSIVKYMEVNQGQDKML